MADRVHPVQMGPTFEHDWPGADAWATDCIMNVVLTGDWIGERMASLLSEYNLTLAAANLLSIVHGAGEPLPHHVISDRMLVRRGTVSWLVNQLEDRGLVRRIPVPGNRRTVLVGITEDGERLLKTFRPQVHALDQALVGRLSREEQKTLIELLSRVQAGLAEQSGH